MTSFSRLGRVPTFFVPITNPLLLTTVGIFVTNLLILLMLRRFDKQFKREAVLRVINSGRPIAAVAQELCIQDYLTLSMDATYLREEENAFPGKGHLKPHEEEILRLKRETEELKQERAILKKALAIFSKHL